MTAEKGFHEIIVILLTAGADINQVDKYSNSALHYATMKGYAKAVDVLLHKQSINLA